MTIIITVLLSFEMRSRWLEVLSIAVWHCEGENTDADSKTSFEFAHDHPNTQTGTSIQTVRWSWRKRCEMLDNGHATTRQTERWGQSEKVQHKSIVHLLEQLCDMASRDIIWFHSLIIPKCIAGQALLRSEGESQPEWGRHATSHKSFR